MPSLRELKRQCGSIPAGGVGAMVGQRPCPLKSFCDGTSSPIAGRGWFSVHHTMLLPQGPHPDNWFGRLLAPGEDDGGGRHVCLPLALWCGPWGPHHRSRSRPLCLEQLECICSSTLKLGAGVVGGRVLHGDVIERVSILIKTDRLVRSVQGHGGKVAKTKTEREDFK